MGVEVKRDEGDKRQFDGLALRNRKPGFTYRWGRKDDFQVALNRFNGYEVVDRKEDAVESVLSSGTRMKRGEDTDSTITLGDLVLMSMPDELYAQRRHNEEQLAIRRQLAVTRGYHAEIARVSGGAGHSYESGHFVGMGQNEAMERQRADAADRASRRDKMKESVSADAYENIMNDLERERGGNP